jgi:hypothetical protein
MWPLDVAATCAAAGSLSLGCPEPTNLGSQASSRKAGLRPRSRTIRMSPDTPGISSRRAAALHPGSEESAAAAASHDERSSGASARGGDAASATRRGRSVPLRCRRRWRFLCKRQFLHGGAALSVLLKTSTASRYCRNAGTTQECDRRVLAQLDLVQRDNANTGEPRARNPWQSISTGASVAGASFWARAKVPA